MASVVTINRPDVVALIEKVAERFTSGNKTEAVARALQAMLDADDRSRPLFGAHRGTLQVDPNWDLTLPTFEDVEFDAYTKPWAADLGPGFDEPPQTDKVSSQRTPHAKRKRR